MDKNLSNRIANVSIDEARLARVLTRKPSQLNYIIFFTPRSGSSWLTETLSNTQQLGSPREWFNPNFTENIANAVGANTPRDYIDVLRRLHQSPNGVFGAQVTFFQYQTIDGFDLVRRLKPDVVFCLRRRDLVAQGISLYRAVASDVYHNTTDLSQQERSAIDELAPYKPKEIGRWMRHISAMEVGMETLFRQRGITPVRLFYEDIAGNTDLAVQLFSEAVLGDGAKPVDIAEASHKPLRSTASQTFASRLRSEHASFVSEMERKRPGFHPAYDHERQQL